MTNQNVGPSYEIRLEAAIAQLLLWGHITPEEVDEFRQCNPYAPSYNALSGASVFRPYEWRNPPAPLAFPIDARCFARTLYDANFMRLRLLAHQVPLGGVEGHPELVLPPGSLNTTNLIEAFAELTGHAKMMFHAQQFVADHRGIELDDPRFDRSAKWLLLPNSAGRVVAVEIDLYRRWVLPLVDGSKPASPFLRGLLSWGALILVIFALNAISRACQ